jgi:beta-lactamase superfamily II metal-dependent hydrolase
MTFQFLDVGMGDSTLVIMGNDPANQELALVDFGVQPFTQFKVGADDAMAYLVKTINDISEARGKKVPYLDHLFITHPDQDHYNRILPLIEAHYTSYGVEDLSIGRLTYGGAKTAYNKGNLINDIAHYVVDKNINNLPSKAHAEVDGMTGEVTADWTFANGHVSVYLLSANYPNTSGHLPNPRSLCLMFEDSDANKVILLGDAESEVEAQIISNFQHAKKGFLNAYGLKLGHHGSLKGTSQAWIDAVKPKAIFASGDFVWAHPYCSTIQRVIAGTQLATMGDHWYCCGIKGGAPYQNNKTKLQVCLNLWYVTSKDGGEDMVDHDGDTEHVDKDTTYGVQWALEFNGAGKAMLYHTDTSNPS